MSAGVACLTGALSSGLVALSIQAAATHVRKRVGWLVEGDLSEISFLARSFNIEDELSCNRKGTGSLLLKDRNCEGGRVSHIDD